MTAIQAAFALALLALLASGVPAATAARRLLDNGAHTISERIQAWMLWCRRTWLIGCMLQLHCPLPRSQKRGRGANR